MNLLSPVSELMTTDLVTVNPKDKLADVKRLFEEKRIHHIPVVRYKSIIGIISKADLLLFERGFTSTQYDELLEKSRLEHYNAEDIMTTGMAKLDPQDRINVALEVFKENLFHAIPVVQEGALVGIITTYDIIKALADGRLETSASY